MQLTVTVRLQQAACDITEDSKLGSSENMEEMETQEEWLSEEALTDDEYQTMKQERLKHSQAALKHNESASKHSESAFHDDDATPSLDSMDESQESISGKVEKTVAESPLYKQSPAEKRSTVTVSVNSEEQNIEDVLNNLDTKNELSDNLSTFLIRKSDGQLIKTDNTKPEKPEEDGNDTDDLLRLLGDGESCKKKVLTKKLNYSNKGDSSDDDDDFRDAKIKKLKIAKDIIFKKKVPTKARFDESSDDDKTDVSEETKPKPVVKKLITTKSTAKPYNDSLSKNSRSTNSNKAYIIHSTPLKTIKSENDRKFDDLKKTDTVTVTAVINGRNVAKTKQGVNINSQGVTINKPGVNISSAVKIKPTVEVKKSVKSTINNVPATENNLKRGKSIDSAKSHASDKMDEDYMDDEEFLDEDEGDDEELEESSIEEGRQRIMRPEHMDEEVPSDDESRSENGSLYDELPSSDSEDMDDWFSFDLRTERAPDYLPLLGPKARELLLEERKSVSSRVNSLRKSLSALTESSRKKAELVRTATMTLAEIDDVLRNT